VKIAVTVSLRVRSTVDLLHWKCRETQFNQSIQQSVSSSNITCPIHTFNGAVYCFM